MRKWDRMISFFKMCHGSFQLHNLSFQLPEQSRRVPKNFQLERRCPRGSVAKLWSQEKVWSRLPAFIIRAFSIKCEPLNKVNNLLRYKTIMVHSESIFEIFLKQWLNGNQFLNNVL